MPEPINLNKEYGDECVIVKLTNVSSSGWTDYTDTINYGESKYYCMISNGCFINIPKQYNFYK